MNHDHILMRPGCDACEAHWQDRVARGELAEPRATHHSQT